MFYELILKRKFYLTTTEKICRPRPVFPRINSHAKWRTSTFLLYIIFSDTHKHLNVLFQKESLDMSDTCSRVLQGEGQKSS